MRPLKESTRSMKLTNRFAATAAVLLMMLPLSGCNRLKSRDALNRGIQAFKNNQYEVAENYFQKAINLDPSYDQARLYLATAYAYQVVPQMTDEKNMALANKAIAGFKEVLAKDPKDKVALQQIASIYRNIKMIKEAKEYELKVIALDPTDAEAHYTIGVIDWAEAYKNATEELAKDGKTDKGDGNPGMSKATCAKIKELNSDIVEDGLTHLQKAIDINPNYDDAMSYLNLVYRRQADFACGNDAARKESIAKADEWSQRSMGARKANEKKKEEKASHGVVTQ